MSDFRLVERVEADIEGEVRRKIALALAEEKADIEGISGDAAFDTMSIMAIINAILAVIQQCKGAAGSRVATVRERPNGFGAFAIRRALVRQFTRSDVDGTRKDARNWARATMRAMASAEASEVAEVLELAESAG